MRKVWPKEARFREVVLVPEATVCGVCGGPMHICDHRHHRIDTLQGPVHLINKLRRCADEHCAGRHVTVSPEAEMSWTMPWWQIGWDLFAWIGHRRFARHWSVPQIRLELQDTHAIAISDDSIARYVALYQTMVAARRQDPAELEQAYRGVPDLILAIDGLQPEKGHETLYVVRELRRHRVWFAEPLLSSAAAEIERLVEQAKVWAERLGRPVRLWISDKQDAFVTGIAKVFPGIPHRYCENHFLRDLAHPVLEADAHAKVAMRRKVRGLRTLEREVLAGSADPEADGTEAGPGAVVLDYCAAVRGVLNDDQGGPLHPPGLRMATGLRDIRASLARTLDAKKGAKRTRGSRGSPGASTGASPRSRRPKPI